jgi:hypothetical protein
MTGPKIPGLEASVLQDNVLEKPAEPAHYSPSAVIIRIYRQTGEGNHWRIWLG